jgi:hypothetical protein
LALLSDKLEEVLPEDHHAFTHLIERQAFSPQDTPCCWLYSQSTLQFREGVEFVGADEAREKF